MNVNRYFAVAAVASLLALGCNAYAQDNNSRTKPTDPQIVGVVTAADQIDIDTAKLALKKTKNDQVKQFAQQMIDDHTKLQGSVNDLGKKLNVTPAPSDISKSLKSASVTEMKKLQGLKGKAFDTEYINNEVAYHQQALFPPALLSDLLGRMLNRSSIHHAAAWMVLYAALITPLTAAAGWWWKSKSANALPSQLITVHQWLGTSLGLAFIALAAWRWRMHNRGDVPGGASWPPQQWF